MPVSTPPAGDILVERDGNAMFVRIDNPSRANAVDPAMLRTLASHMTNPDEGVRVIVLTGAGTRHFCAGIDMRGIAVEDLPEHLRAGESALRLASSAVAEAPVPVVAAINGAAFGGGLELAISCDWRIAAATATMGMPAARLGIVYAPEGLQRFLACLGPARTRQLFVGGRSVGAERAHQIGLVDDVIAPGEWDAAIADVVTGVSAGSSLAVAATRAAIGALAPAHQPEAVSDIESLRRNAFADPEFREALAAFAEGRPPRWMT